MSVADSKPHASAPLVETTEQLEASLVAGLESGESQPMTDDDWNALRRRAMIGTELRKRD